MNNDDEKSAGFISKLRKIGTTTKPVLPTETPYSPKKACRFVCKKSTLWKGRKTVFFAAKIPRKRPLHFRLQKVEKQLPRKGEKQVRQRGISRGFRVVLFAHEIVCDFRFADASNSRSVFFSSFALFAFSSVLVVPDDFSLCHCSFRPVNSIPSP